ncbi:parkin co-regulated protein-domain-containing protein [Globomyces pollinis-pini]|nr:parkin co-regulated protein-domain-containing protein [Globomyces pollinis-pini]KAJ3000986.1 hypothetical protein HDV02_000055 [Globomyces sp. JEL0801]
MMSKATTGRIPHAGKGSSNSTKQIEQPKSKSIVAPLGNHRHLTPFSAVYSKGGIPCRLHHGSVKHKLVWTRDIASLDYNPLFVTFCEGLKETQHPFKFIVEHGLKDLLEASGAAEKVLAVMPNAITPLRNGLAQSNKDMFLTSLSFFRRLINLLGEDLLPYLGVIIPPIGAKALIEDAEVRELVQETLTDAQLACGKDALQIIRKRVPTFNPQMI